MGFGREREREREREEVADISSTTTFIKVVKNSYD
jgi:hypothetical protein